MVSPTRLQFMKKYFVFKPSHESIRRLQNTQSPPEISADGRTKTIRTHITRSLTLNTINRYASVTTPRDSNPAHDDDEKHIETAKTISKIIRSNSRWEETLQSEICPNLFTAQCVRKVISLQNDTILALRFFLWAVKQQSFLHEESTYAKIIDMIFRAKGWKAATALSKQPECRSSSVIFEVLVKSFCRIKMVSEAIDTFDEMRGLGFFPGVETCNELLQCLVRVNRTDLFWRVYGEILECGVLADVQTFGYLIQAFCKEGKLKEARELLDEVLENGWVPDVFTFNEIIGRFSRQDRFRRVSELLHLMIAKGCMPDIRTYTAILDGLCKNGRVEQGLWLFDDLKERGYDPDVVTYTVLMDGLGKMGKLEAAGELWIEMQRKGLSPNTFSYNVLIDGHCKQGNMNQGQRLLAEMYDRGCEPDIVAYNTLIAGFFLESKIDEANNLRKKILEKGLNQDLITYNTFIQGRCNQGNVLEAL
jgi:pentatricopeptide repeat protein